MRGPAHGPECACCARIRDPTLLAAAARDAVAWGRRAAVVVTEAFGSPGQSTSSNGPPAELLAASYTHLRELGLAAPDAMPAWRLLGGGVSNWVILFECGEGVV